MGEVAPHSIVMSSAGDPEPAQEFTRKPTGRICLMDHLNARSCNEWRNSGVVPQLCEPI